MNSTKQNEPTPAALGVTRVASFEIFHRRYLNQDGQSYAAMPDYLANVELLEKLYGQMTLARLFDEKAVALQRTGRLGTYASLLGEEAVGVGLAAAMREEDVLLPSFREQAAQLGRGVSIAELLLYWGGDERGNDFSIARHDFPNCVPIATQVPHAAGCALAFKTRNEPRVAVAVAGDGATSKGDFYEGLNLAGVWQLPMLMLVVNNGWAISVPRSAQSHAETLAQKAIATGIETEQVDGNDVLAVYAAIHEALEDIRVGNGPRLIEVLTYRLGDHTTADDARRYRTDEEVSAHWAGDPLVRMRQHLTNMYGWNKEKEQALLARVRKQVQDGVDGYVNKAAQPVSSIFDSLFETLPAALQQQRQQIVGGESDKELGDA